MKAHTAVAKIMLEYSMSQIFCQSLDFTWNKICCTIQCLKRNLPKEGHYLLWWHWEDKYWVFMKLSSETSRKVEDSCSVLYYKNRGTGNWSYIWTEPLYSMLRVWADQSGTWRDRVSSHLYLSAAFLLSGVGWCQRALKKMDSWSDPIWVKVPASKPLRG